MLRTDRWVMLLAALMAVLVVAAGCGKKNVVVPGVIGLGEIDVLLPCGQIGPFSEALALFEEQHPGVTVKTSPENIVTMTKKVLDGKAQPDVFLSMGDLEMDKLEAGGLLVPDTRVEYAENALAITVPSDNPAGVESLADLAKPEVKSISIPNPEQNAVGKHAKEALENAGLWEKVAGKVILPQFAADGKAVVAEGKVEASIGYYPCVVEVKVPGEQPMESENMPKMVALVPADLYQPFGCEAAVIVGAKNPAGGRALIAFLQTPAVQEIYRKWKFAREPVDE